MNRIKQIVKEKTIKEYRENFEEETIEFSSVTGTVIIEYIFHAKNFSIVNFGTVYLRLLFCSVTILVPHLHYFLPKNFVAERTPKEAATITPKEY